MQELGVGFPLALQPNLLDQRSNYLHAAAIAKESLETGKSLRQLVLEKGLMTEADLADVLNLEQMSQLPPG